MSAARKGTRPVSRFLLAATWVAVELSFVPCRAERTEESRPLQLDVPLSSALERDDGPVYSKMGRYRVFSFASASDAKVTFRLESIHFDAHLVIQDAGGDKLAEDADSGLGDGAELVFEAKAGEQYRILAISRDREGVGEFQLLALGGEPESLTGRERLERDRDWCERALKMKGRISPQRRVAVSRELGRALLRLGNFPRARTVLDGAREEAARLHLDGVRAELLRLLGIAAVNLGELDECEKCFLEALTIYRARNDRRNEAGMFTSLGNLYNELNQPDKALEFLGRALEAAQRTGDRALEARTHAGLGNAYSELGEPKKAVDHYKKSLAIHIELKNRRSQAIVLGNIGNAYSRTGELEKSVGFYQRALAIYKEEGDRQGEGIVLMNLASIWTDLGRLEQAKGNL